MATYTFSGAIAWNRLGSFVTTSNGITSKSIKDPSTGNTPAGLTQGGVAVTQITTTALGGYSFSTTDVLAVLVDFGAGVFTLMANELPNLLLTAAAPSNAAIDNRVKWQPSTGYALGQQVLSPNNDVVKANTAHTSSAAYATDVAKWDLSYSFPRVVNRAGYASFAAAATAAGSGGTVWYPDGQWNEPALTISTPLTVTGNRVTINKTANGAMLTITAQGVRLGRGLTLNGQASTYTGPGVVITGNGTTQDTVIDADIVNCDQWAVDVGIGAAQRGFFGAGLFSTKNKTAADAAMTSGSAVLTSATAAFTAADVGKYALVQGAYSAAQPTWYLLSKEVTYTSATSVTLADNANVTVSGKALEVHYPAFRFGAEFAASVTGDRHLIGCKTGGYLLADVGGAQTLTIDGTNSRGVVFSDSQCAKVSISGANRLATSGAPTILHGVNHVVAGATIAGDLILETDCSASSVAGNVTAGDVINKNNTNTVAPARADSKLPQSVDPSTLSAASTLNANQAVFIRATGSWYISKIGVHVGTASGNVCVGVYSNTGHGNAALPTTLKATSGSVACPAAGYQEIALTSSVWCADGDWLAIVADNATAAFYRGTTNGFSSSLAKGRSAFQNTAFPLPATTTTPSVSALFSVLLLGID